MELGKMLNSAGGGRGRHKHTQSFDRNRIPTVSSVKNISTADEQAVLFLTQPNDSSRDANTSYMKAGRPPAG